MIKYHCIIFFYHFAIIMRQSILCMEEMTLNYLKPMDRNIALAILNATFCWHSNNTMATRKKSKPSRYTLRMLLKNSLLRFQEKFLLSKSGLWISAISLIMVQTKKLHNRSMPNLLPVSSISVYSYQRYGQGKQLIRNICTCNFDLGPFGWHMWHCSCRENISSVCHPWTTKT